MSNTALVYVGMGYLLSFALHNFSLSSYFTTLRGTLQDDLDAKIAEFEPLLGIVRRPGAIIVLWNFVPQLTALDSSFGYTVVKLLEILPHTNHRNQAVLSSMGLTKLVFTRFCEARQDASVSEKERHVLQKLLRRLLEMGASTAEARSILQRAVKEDETLDLEMLDIVRLGIKSRWLEHFSMESPAALIIEDEKSKGLPAAGFTLMVRRFRSSL